jgi:hypothetical protein
MHRCWVADLARSESEHSSSKARQVLKDWVTGEVCLDAISEEPCEVSVVF